MRWVLPLLMLTACSQPQATVQPGPMCAALASHAAVMSSTSPDHARAFEAADNCVASNAYDMAGAGDPANDVAQAAVAACQREIRDYAVLSAAMLNRVRADPSVTPDVSADQVERTTRADLTDKALVVVVRARADHCHG